MKFRYFLLFSIYYYIFMILIVDYNNEIINKRLFIGRIRTINYSFFSNDNIDIFIENYLEWI